MRTYVTHLQQHKIEIGAGPQSKKSKRSTWNMFKKIRNIFTNRVRFEMAKETKEDESKTQPTIPKGGKENMGGDVNALFDMNTRLFEMETTLGTVTETLSSLKKDMDSRFNELEKKLNHDNIQSMIDAPIVATERDNKVTPVSDTSAPQSPVKEVNVPSETTGDMLLVVVPRTMTPMDMITLNNLLRDNSYECEIRISE